MQATSREQDGGGTPVAGNGISLNAHELAAARRAWSAGDWHETRHRAQKALAAGATARDHSMEASAALLLAHALALESQFDWASRFAQRAQRLFHELGDTAWELEALLALSHAESALGRDEQALRAASEAVAGSRQMPLLCAAALNCVGVASLWTGDYGTARGVLDEACRLAQGQPGQPDGSFQPLVNAGFTEVLRCAVQRMRGQPVDVADLAGLLARAQQLKAAGAALSLVQAAPAAGLLLLEFESFYAAHLAGDSALADGHYLASLGLAARLPEGCWMRALVWWARLERAMAARNVEEALESAQAMVHASQRGEHEHMKRLASRLHLHAQGWLDEAPSFSATWF